MDDIVRLGFSVDSSGLARAQRDAEAAARGIGQLGERVDALGRRGPVASQAMQRVGAEMARVADAGQRMQGVVQNASAQIGSLAQAFGIATGSGAGVALNGALIGANGAINTLSGMMGRFGPVASGMVAGVGAIGTALIGASTALAMAQDKYAQYESRIKNALGSQALAAQSMESLAKQATAAGIAFDGTADAFIRLARNGDALGATTPELLQLTDTIQKLGIVSGASSGEVQSGMIQLSQALASGKLNGDELRSVMENMPALAKAIADGLGVSVGALRSMGAAGELNGKKVFEAILSQTAKVDDEFKKMPDTVERAFTRMSNAAQGFAADLGKAMNSSEFVRDLLKRLEEKIGLARDIVKGTVETPQQRKAKLETQLFSTDPRERAFEQYRPKLQAEYNEILKKEAEAKAESEKAAKLEADKKRFGGINQANTIAKDIDDHAKKATEAQQNIATLEAGITQLRIKMGETSDSKEASTLQKQLDGMNRSLIISKQKAVDAADAFGVLAQSTAKMQQAIALGGGGGGIGIVQEAQDLVKRMNSQGRGASLSSAIRAVTREKATGVSGDATNIDQQTTGVRAMIGVLDQSREAVMETEIAVEAMNLQWKTFGTLTDSKATEAIKAYTNALRRSKEATEEQAEAQKILNATKAADDAEAMAGAVTPQQKAMLQFSNRIRDSRSGLRGDAANRVEEEVRREKDAGDKAAFEAHLDGLRTEMSLTQEKIGLVGLIGREERVQNALLAKRQELAQSSIIYTQAQRDEILLATEALANQQYVLERNQQLQQTTNAFWEQATDTLTDFFLIGKNGFKDLADYAIRELMRIQVRESVIQPLAGLSKGLFAGASEWLKGALTPNAQGGVYASSDLHSMRNSVVSRPTLFRFAQGANFGEVGETGSPEAIVPLKRTRSGDLGVQMSGGGPSVTIHQDIKIDSRTDQATIFAAMRQAKDAAINEIHQSMKRGGVFA